MKRVWFCLWMIAVLLTGCAGPAEAPAAHQEAQDASAAASDAETAAGPDEGTADERQGEIPTETYWDEPLDHLAPDQGYGALVPYVGRELQPEGEIDPANLDLYWYGLATTDGRIVTAPVYAAVERLWYNTADWGSEWIPAYALWTEKSWASDEPRLCAVAALDGSWCTEAVYLGAEAIGPDRMLLADRENRMWFCDLEGHITPTAIDHPVSDLWVNWQADSGNLHSAVAMMDAAEGGGWFLNFDTGTERYFPESSGGMWNGRGELLAASETDGRYGYLDYEGRWVISPQFFWADDFYGSYGLVRRTGSGVDELIDASGQTVLSADGGVFCTVVRDAPYWIAVDAEGRITDIRDRTLQAVDLPARGARNLPAGNALAWEDEAGKRWFWDGETVFDMPDDTLLLDEIEEGKALFSRITETTPRRSGLYDLEGERWILEPVFPGDCFLLRSGKTLYFSTDNLATVYDSCGRRLFSASWFGTPVDGVFPVVDGNWSGLVGQDGQWLVRLPLDTGTT